MKKGVKSKKFLQQAEHLLAHIVCLSQRKKKCVTPSNNYLANSIGCSERQVVRYLQHLKEINKLSVNTITVKDATNVEKPYKRHRTIQVASKEIPRHFKELTKIHFSKETPEAKKKMIQQIWFKQEWRTPVKTTQTVYAQPELKPVLEVKTNSYKANAWIERANKEPTVKQMTEDRERQMALYEEGAKEEAKERDLKKFTQLQNELINNAIKTISNGAKIKAGTPKEALIEANVNLFREAWSACELFASEEPNLIPDKIKSLVDSVVYKDKEIYIQMYLNGTTRHEIKLFDYVPWTPNDEYHIMFLKELNK